MLHGEPRDPERARDLPESHSKSKQSHDWNPGSPHMTTCLSASLRASGFNLTPRGRRGGGKISTSSPRICLQSPRPGLQKEAGWREKSTEGRRYREHCRLRLQKRSRPAGKQRRPQAAWQVSGEKPGVQLLAGATSSDSFQMISSNRKNMACESGNFEELSGRELQVEGMV